MAFCSNCGYQLAEGAKFCSECGVKVGTKNPSLNTRISEDRQQAFVGTILKCATCGSSIGETDAVCPVCRAKITCRSAVNSVQLFKEQLMAIENSRKKSRMGMFSIYAPADPADKQKLSLIRNYPIPNTIDDIFEFMMLAVANIDVKLSKKTIMNSSQSMEIMAAEMPKAISNAWVAKLQQTYQKAEAMFPEEHIFASMQKIYFEKMKELKIKV